MCLAHYLPLRNPPQVEDFLHHAGIEGVYELGTPLVYRAMLHVGCVARVAKGRAEALKGVQAGLGQAPGFELEDLELVTAVRMRSAWVVGYVLLLVLVGVIRRLASDYLVWGCSWGWCLVGDRVRVEVIFRARKLSDRRGESGGIF